MGAYTLTMKNDFNGFYSSPKVFMKEKSSRRFVDESLAIHKTSPFILQKNET